MAKNLRSELNSLCTVCTYCDECPVNIPIPKLMESFNNYILFKGDKNAVINQLGAHWGINGSSAKDCTKCGKCEELCTQKLPIMERLQTISEW